MGESVVEPTKLVPKSPELSSSTAGRGVVSGITVATGVPEISSNFKL